MKLGQRYTKKDGKKVIVVRRGFASNGELVWGLSDGTMVFEEELTNDR